MIRLDKYLADMGVGTRQEVKHYIRKGRITVDDVCVKKPECKVNLDTQVICFDGAAVAYVEYEYYMLNKPSGVISATEDKKQSTVIELIKSKKRKDLFPVGRLDKDTEGLLLITNDGALAHRLLAPKKHVDKVYYAKIDGVVTEQTIDAFAAGINIGTSEQEIRTRPAKLAILESGKSSSIRLTIHEGKFHQVKRMFHAVGMDVTYLKRESMGSLILDAALEPGEYRALTETEVEQLS